MNNKTLILRPMMKISDMVPYLKNRNIKFECCSEQDAEIYLKENNNYYNVTSYKNNFVKYQCGELEGKYIDLDFAYLKDLSIIDYRTRLVLFKMIIDIEHYLKIRILNTIEEISEEDGYKIVNLIWKKILMTRNVLKECMKALEKKYQMSIIKKYFLNTI